MPQPERKTLLAPLSLLMAAALLLTVRPAAAHLEKAPMPDAVAEMEYRILLEFEPDNLEVRNRLGMVLYRLDKPDEARGEFEYVLMREPENFDALDGLGLVQAARGEHARAVETFRKAAALKPADVLVYYHLALALEKLGRLTDALDSCRTGLRKNRDTGNPEIRRQQEQLLEQFLARVQREVAD